MDATTARIAHLNDVCRTAPGLGGKWVCTQGFAALADPLPHWTVVHHGGHCAGAAWRRARCSRVW
jgi:hypothetical protein